MKGHAALSIISVLSLLGQDSAPLFKVDVRLVDVYATIYDHKGRYVDGLTRERFSLSDNGTKQPLVSFENSTSSLSCAILLDTTGSMNAVLPMVKNAIMKFIDQLNPDDSVAVYTFNSTLQVNQEFTRDKDAAKRAVLRTRARGETALYDSISQAASALVRQPGKKALVVFTDGQDNASVLNKNAAVKRAKKLGIPLYAIAEGDALKSKELMKTLEDLSNATGGTAYALAKAGKVGDVFADIAQDLQHVYMMSYKAPPGNEGDWRRIGIVVSGIKDYRIRAKEGYISE